MINARKLKLGIAPVDFNRAGKVIDRHAFTQDAPEGRLVRKYTPAKQIEMLRSALPESLRDRLLTVNYSEIRLLKAHVHVTDESVINFYQSTNGEVTTFWDGPEERDDAFTSDNGNNYFNLRHQNLSPAESFVAKSGDVWLLNTKKPHSVSMSYNERPRARHFMNANDMPRYVVQAFFDAPFDFIAQQLADAKMIDSPEIMVGI